MEVRPTGLSVERLCTRIDLPERSVAALEDVSFDVPAGTSLALVGESGSGKSLTALSILRLLPPNARVAGGQVRVDGRELTGLSEAQMCRERGRAVGIVFQDAFASLDPLVPVRAQLVEAIRVHRRVGVPEARRRAVQLLEAVGFVDPEVRSGAFPHQLSGGMRQRVLLAMALAPEPSALIADEPTTALDLALQRQILELLVATQRERGLALLLITHDLSVAQSCDQLAVMYAGRIVEQGPSAAVLASPLHPYTAGLLRSVPGRARPGQPLQAIPGSVPQLLDRPEGCAFADRCDRTQHLCRAQRPALEQRRAGQSAACHFPLELPGGAA